MSNITFQSDVQLTTQANELMPYSFAIGLKIGRDTDNQLLFCLPFQKQNIGNIFLPALHGGLINGFMQSCMTLFLHHQTPSLPLLQPVNSSIDYLRSGQPADCFAQCTLVRQGSRIINVSGVLWQEDANKPIAVAHAHFLVPQT